MNNNTKDRSSLSPHIPILILGFVLAILTSCVLSPIYTQIDNDITLMYTVLPMIVDTVIILFESLYIAMLCAVAAYSVYGVHKGNESKVATIIPILAVIFLKHTLNLVISSIIDGYIDISFDIPVTIMLLAADTLLLTVVALTANNKCKRHFQHAKKMIKASKYLNTVDYNESSSIYPFKGLFDIKNPIILPIFIGALISTALLVIQRIYADIFVLGAPQNFFEIAEMIIFYLIDILIGFAAYTASYFAAKYIFINVTANNVD